MTETANYPNINSARREIPKEFPLYDPAGVAHNVRRIFYFMAKPKDKNPDPVPAEIPPETIQTPETPADDHGGVVVGKPAATIPAGETIKPEIKLNSPEIKLTAESPAGIPEIKLNSPEIPISEASPPVIPISENPPAGDPPKRGRGRPPGSKTGSGSATTPPGLPPGVDQEKLISGTAGMTFDLSAGALANIFGAEWLPKSPDERNFVVSAIAAYYRETGVKEISPKMMLLIAVASYSAPRLAEPNTRDKLKMFWLWGKNKLSGIAGFFRGNKK